MSSYSVDKNRGTGRTTRQMQAMPQNGIFISCNHACMYYDIQLTRKLNRTDIRVVGPDWVTGMSWQGHTYSAIVLDHYYHVMNKNDPIFNRYWDGVQTRVRNAKKI